jgi:hypothetical protein
MVQSNTGYEGINPSNRRHGLVQANMPDGEDNYARADAGIAKSPNRLPVIAALQTEEDALDNLFQQLNLLEKDLEPLLNQASSGFEADVNVPQDVARTSQAVELSESNTRRIYLAADRINVLLQRIH